MLNANVLALEDLKIFIDILLSNFYILKDNAVSLFWNSEDKSFIKNNSSSFDYFPEPRAL